MWALDSSFLGMTNRACDRNDEQRPHKIRASSHPFDLRSALLLIRVIPLGSSKKITIPNKAASD